jgi:hypothetical protein
MRRRSPRSTTRTTSRFTSSTRRSIRRPERGLRAWPASCRGGETLGELLHRRQQTGEPTELAEARRIGLAIINGVATFTLARRSTATFTAVTSWSPTAQ